MGPLKNRLPGVFPVLLTVFSLRPILGFLR